MSPKASKAGFAQDSQADGEMSVGDERKWMRIAIEQMKLSRSEHSGKPDPLVGAVLASKADIELRRAHRANLRAGHHAEYTILERMLQDKSVEGATMFVTLEPCAPGSRTPPKKGCAEWIVGARISKVFIGIPDPYPSVS